MKNCLPLIFLLLSLAAPSFAQSPFYAAQLTDDNLHKLPEGGMDAIGGRDDWFLTNGELCAVISGADHPTYLSQHGASLVDLWQCVKGNDQWNSSHTQFNLQKDQIPVTREITAGFDGKQAWIETLGSREGLDARIRYRLTAASPGQLDIETTVTRSGPGAGFGMFGSLILHPRGSLTPFTLDTETGEFSRGLDQLEVDIADFGSILASMAVADLQVLLGSRHIDPSISYGVQAHGAVQRDASGNESPLHLFQLGGRDFTLLGAFTSPFPQWWSRAPGPISFLAGQMFNLDEQESFVLQQSILVGSGDAASISDQLYTGAVMSGKLDTAEAGIAVNDDTGTALTFVRPAPDGSFRFRLPEGVQRIALEIETPWGNTSQLADVSPNTTLATGAGTDLGTIDTGAVATLLLPAGQPMSLAFQSDHFRPIFGHALVGASVGGERVLSGPESYRLTLSGTEHDLRQVQLPPGTYDIIASRGPEFGVTRTQLVLTAQETTTLDIEAPPRVLETPGLVSADLHLHSGLSFDSSISPEQRVIDFIAQGAEVLVATEHNVTYDIGPTVAAMGLAGDILTIPGVEITGMVRSPTTPMTIGHSNVFPVPADENAFMGGTLPFEGLRLGQVISAYKARFPGSIYQLNHPRDLGWDDDIAYFNHLSQSENEGYDPTKPLTEMPNAVLLQQHPGTHYRDIDFDAMELMNAYTPELYKLLREDWFSLLRQNMYKVATANSDSHQSSQIVAYPRNMLVVPDDSIAALDSTAIADAIRNGKLYGTTGPMLEIALAGAGPGDTLAGNGGELSITARCADWVNVDEARIWVNGELLATLPIKAGVALTKNLSFAQDSFVFVEVQGTASDTYRTVVPGYSPFAFANPVFIDVGGNGWRYGESASP
ncbi:MAG: hypothetical protein ACI9NT_000435 [Bacteroidia bacterium]|jgi:hypothetical protein